MQARARFLGHPIHQMLIVLPLGMLGGAFIFDAIHVFTGGARWAEIAFWLIAVGLISGGVAAVFGFIDWRAIPPNTRARRVGAWHGTGNLAVVLLFAGSWLLRRADPLDPGVAALALGTAGILLAGFTGWLGGELVGRLGVGVDPGAHVDAPSSLSGRPADRSRSR